LAAGSVMPAFAIKIQTKLAQINRIAHAPFWCFSVGYGAKT